jgi:hypothetical protein
MPDVAVQINGGETAALGFLDPRWRPVNLSAPPRRCRPRVAGVGIERMNQPDHRRSLAAERMRRHRERRRDGLRCLVIELRETEIDALIGSGLLDNEMRNDPGAIIDALYVFLDHTLDATP